MQSAPHEARVKQMQRSAGGDDRVMLVTTVKDEGPNILEWIGYHRMIGFTDIVVFQNDSFDTTERALWTLQEMGVIRYLNNDFRTPRVRDHLPEPCLSSRRAAAGIRRGKMVHGAGRRRIPAR